MLSGSMLDLKGEATRTCALNFSKCWEDALCMNFVCDVLIQ